jgi:capsular polysaccharide transport system permease protein
MDDSDTTAGREPSGTDVPGPGALAGAAAGVTGLTGSATLAPVGPPERATPLQFQFRVLKALVLRDMTAKHGDSRLGYLLGLLMPLVLLASMVALFGLRGRIAPANFSLFAFVVTGYPLWMAFITQFRQAIQGASRSNTLLMFPQITQLDLILASFILEAATGTVVFTILVLGGVMFFKAGVPEAPVGVLFCYWACTWLGWSLGLALCAVQRILPLFMNFFSMFIRFGMWVSGVIFMADRMPEYVLVYLRWNPILHAVEGARESWNSAYQSPVFDPSYIIVCGFVLMTVGVVSERLTRRFVGP